MSEDKAVYETASSEQMALHAQGLVDSPSPTLRERIAADPAAFDFSDIAIPEEAPRYTLPVAIGDYRAVTGHPGWYLRPMRLRQEIAITELLARPDRVNANSLRDACAMASLVLWRLDLPADADEARTALVAHVRGTRNAWRAASEDEIMDEFTSDTLQSDVLAPLGYGITPADGAQSAVPLEGNA